MTTLGLTAKPVVVYLSGLSILDSCQHWEGDNKYGSQGYRGIFGLLLLHLSNFCMAFSSLAQPRASSEI
jgi:hypothetical protein